MKIKTRDLSYEEVIKLPRSKHKNPRKPNFFLKRLIKVLADSDLKKACFSYETVNMDAVGDRPCLVLMNHSSFIDLEIAEKLWYPKPLQIVCTSDGFVGKDKRNFAICTFVCSHQESCEILRSICSFLNPKYFNISCCNPYF